MLKHVIYNYSKLFLRNYLVSIMNKKITLLLIQFVCLISFSQTSKYPKLGGDGNNGATGGASNSQSNIPFNANINGSDIYSLTETIYKYSEIGTYGTITKIGWRHSSGDFRFGNNDNLKIYLRMTSATSPGSTIDLSQYTLVYNDKPQKLNDNGSNFGWKYVNITPYEYVSFNSTPENLDIIVLLNRKITYDDPRFSSNFWNDNFGTNTTNSPTTRWEGSSPFISNSTITLKNQYVPRVSLQFSSVTALPIELTSFTAEENQRKVDLKWITASERNNHYFTIYRSSDLKSWEKVVKIKGKGNSSQETSYSFTDENPLKGMNYYKLKQTDFDGRYEEFNPISILIGNRNSISVYPNPAKDVLFIHTENQQLQMSLQISDYSGKTIYSYSGEQQSIDISTLNTGIYFLSIEINGNTERHKIEVQ